MTKEERLQLAIEKDEVLSYLVNEREVDLMNLDFMVAGSPINRFYQLFFKHRFELEQGGYIEYHEDDGPVLDIQRTKLMPAGYVFNLNGGYTLIEQDRQFEEERKRTEWKWRRGYEGVTLFIALLAIGFTAATYFFGLKDSDLEKLQSQINAMKRTAPHGVKMPPKVKPVVTPPISRISTKNKP